MREPGRRPAGWGKERLGDETVSRYWQGEGVARKSSETKRCSGSPGMGSQPATVEVCRPRPQPLSHVAAEGVQCG